MNQNVPNQSDPSHFGVPGAEDGSFQDTSFPGDGGDHSHQQAPVVDFASVLGAHDNAFATTQVSIDGKVPDGKYQASIVEATLTTSKAKDPMLKIKLRVVGPNHVGTILYKNTVIGPNTIGFLKADLMRLKIGLTKLSELPTRLHEFAGKVIEINCKANGDNTNIYINKVIQNFDGGGSSGGPTSDFGGVGNGLSSPALAGDNPFGL